MIILTIPPVDQLRLESSSSVRRTSDTLETPVHGVAHDELARGEAEVCSSAPFAGQMIGRAGRTVQSLTWTKDGDDEGWEDGSPIRGVLPRHAHDDVADEEGDHGQEKDEMA